MSSHTEVSRVKRLLGQDKAGHTGTLDPMATGVLPVLIGRDVKASEYMLTSDKHYIARLLLGITTDTEDVTGEVLSRSERVPTVAEVAVAIRSMLGESLQTPPMYSALKVGGRKLCDLAREGKTVEREARAITVYSIEYKRISELEYELDVKCSKGTYIRTLCADIGKKLGTGGVMKALRRAEASGFTLSDSIKISELEALTEAEREARILPVESVFRKEKKITLPKFFAKLARCGVEIYLKKLGVELSMGERVTLYDEKGFFALGEVRDFDDGAAIKPIKQFDT
jgi:tRNA pseudouridine55 synthase